MPATIGPNAQQQAFALSGGYFVYTDASTATLTVSGFDGYCHVEVGNAISKRVVSFNYHLTMSLAVNGPGGLHPTHFPEQASTVYTIYLAWKSATAAVNGTICLFSVPSGTTIDAAKLTALEAGYDYVSRPIGFVINDAAGNVTQFQHEKDWWLVNINGGSGLSATVQTAIPLTAVVPAECRAFATLAGAYDNTAATRNLTIYHNTGINYRTFVAYGGLGNVNGSQVQQFRLHIVPLTAPPATVLAYAWSAAPSHGLGVDIRGVQIGSTDREGP